MWRCTVRGTEFLLKIDCSASAHRLDCRTWKGASTISAFNVFEALRKRPNRTMSLSIGKGKIAIGTESGWWQEQVFTVGNSPWFLSTFCRRERRMGVGAGNLSIMRKGSFPRQEIEAIQPAPIYPKIVGYIHIHIHPYPLGSRRARTLAVTSYYLSLPPSMLSMTSYFPENNCNDDDQYPKLFADLHGSYKKNILYRILLF